MPNHLPAPDAPADPLAANPPGRRAARRRRRTWWRFWPLWPVARKVGHDKDIRYEFLGAIMIGTYPLVGACTWYLTKAVADWDAQAAQTAAERDIDADRKMALQVAGLEREQAFRLIDYRDKQDVLTAFADGIPQNQYYLSSICLKLLWLDHNLNRDGDAASAAGARYFDGRDYKETAASVYADQQAWLSTCRHYTSLCEQARGRFSDAVGRRAGHVRFALDRLNEIDLTPSRLRDLAGRLSRELAGDPDALPDDLRRDAIARLDAIAASLAGPDAAAPDNVLREASALAEVVAEVVDALYLATVRQMGDELKANLQDLRNG